VTTTIERFLTKINIVESGCWEWTAFKNKKGYGMFHLVSKTPLSHRFIYEYYYGQICPDLTIDHVCRNRACVNPIHLEQVTMQINNLRGNSMSGINMRKTQCKRGHSLSGINLIIENMQRRCRTCTNTRKRITRKLETF